MKFRGQVQVISLSLRIIVTCLLWQTMCFGHGDLQPRETTWGRPAVPGQLLHRGLVSDERGHVGDLHLSETVVKVSV